MEWAYKYLLIPKWIPEIRDNALRLGFEDMTETAVQAIGFAELQQKEVVKLWEEKADDDRLAQAVHRRPEDPKVAAFLDAHNGLQDNLPIYFVTFHMYENGAVLVRYMTSYFDPTAEWTTLVIALLHKIGYRGSAILVSANSAADAADIVELSYGDENVHVVTHSGGSGKRSEETLREYRAPVDLVAVHNQMIEDKLPPLFLVLGYPIRNP